MFHSFPLDSRPTPTKPFRTQPGPSIASLFPDLALLSDNELHRLSGNIELLSPIAHKKQSGGKAAPSVDFLNSSQMEENFGQASVRSRMLAQGRAVRERIGCEGNQNRILAENAFGLRRNEGACENEFGRLSAHSNSSVNFLGRPGYGGRAEQEKNLVERLKAELMRVKAERDEAEAKVEILQEKLLEKEHLYDFLKADHIKLLEKTAKSRTESKAMEIELKAVKEKLLMAEEENGHFSIVSVQQNLMAQEQGQKIMALMEEVAELKAKDRGKEMKAVKEKLEMAEEENAHFSILSVQQNLMAQEQSRKIMALMEEVEELKAKKNGKDKEKLSKSPGHQIADKKFFPKSPPKVNIVKKSKADIAKPTKISIKPEADKSEIRPLNSIIFRKHPNQIKPNYRPPSLFSIRTFPLLNGKTVPFSSFSQFTMPYPTPSPYLAPAFPFHYIWLINSNRMADQSIPNFLNIISSPPSNSIAMRRDVASVGPGETDQNRGPILASMGACRKKDI
ncbi:hypothetical protein niasHT_033633 [Heterodera trifolii]|uniref:Uncharacterized protein n=1 Tax=Heterodera trifolii TaxID=157864 RepID=A0ABD2IPB5_9BILA